MRSDPLHLGEQLPHLRTVADHGLNTTGLFRKIRLQVGGTAAALMLLNQDSDDQAVPNGCQCNRFFQIV